MDNFNFHIFCTNGQKSASSPIVACLVLSLFNIFNRHSSSVFIFWYLYLVFHVRNGDENEFCIPTQPFFFSNLAIAVENVF